MDCFLGAFSLLEPLYEDKVINQCLIRYRTTVLLTQYNLSCIQGKIEYLIRRNCMIVLQEIAIFNVFCHLSSMAPQDFGCHLYLFSIGFGFFLQRPAKVTVLQGEMPCDISFWEAEN